MTVDSECCGSSVHRAGIPYERGRQGPQSWPHSPLSTLTAQVSGHLPVGPEPGLRMLFNTALHPGALCDDFPFSPFLLSLSVLPHRLCPLLSPPLPSGSTSGDGQSLTLLSPFPASHHGQDEFYPSLCSSWELSVGPQLSLQATPTTSALAPLTHATFSYVLLLIPSSFKAPCSASPPNSQKPFNL